MAELSLNQISLSETAHPGNISTSLDTGGIFLFLGIVSLIDTSGHQGALYSSQGQQDWRCIWVYRSWYGCHIELPLCIRLACVYYQI